MNEELLQKLIDILKEADWGICIPNLKPDDDVPGMIIGTDEYIKSITDQLKD